MALSTQLSNIAKMLSQNGGGVGIPDDPREQTKLQQAGVTDPLISMMGQAGMGLFGGSNASEGQILRDRTKRVREDIGEFDLGTSGGLKKAAGVYQKAGMPEKALDLIRKSQERLVFETDQTNLNKARLQTSERLKKQGMEDAAKEALTASPGRLQELQKRSTTQEDQDRTITNSIPARKRVAESLGLPWTKTLAEASEENFNKITSGEERKTLEPYSQGGKNLLLPTVGDSVYINGKWLRGDDLPADLQPVINETIQRVSKMNATIAEESGKFIVGDMAESLKGSEEAYSTLHNNRRMLALVNKGIPSGATGELQQFFMSVVAEIPGVDPAIGLTVSDGEQYIQLKGKQLLKILPDLGPPLSDKDVEKAEVLIGMTFTSREETMRAILELESIAARAKIWQHKSQVEIFRNVVKDSEAENMVNYFNPQRDMEQFKNMDFSKPVPQDPSGIPMAERPTNADGIIVLD